MCADYTELDKVDQAWRFVRAELVAEERNQVLDGSEDSTTKSTTSRPQIHAAHVVVFLLSDQPLLWGAHALGFAGESC